MRNRKLKQKLRIGIETKSVMMLAAVMLLAMGAGGWLHYKATRETDKHSNLQQAEWLSDALAVAAAAPLVDADLPALRRLADGLLAQLPSARSAVILDRHGNTVASAARGGETQHRELTCRRPSLAYKVSPGTSLLEIGRPVVAPAGKHGQGRLLGAVRLVLDTRPTARVLAGLRKEVLLMAALMLLCAIPLGQLLVRRTLAIPLRRLARTARRLAGGDFSARTQTRRGDEIGELAEAFDTMAERLHASQRQLGATKGSLERKVAEATAELQQANVRLRQEVAEKEDLLRAVSHDLNAPLRNIAGMATMILLKHRDILPEGVTMRLERIRANVDLETDLLAELLELSSLKTSPQKKEVVDFAELLEGLEAGFEYELRQKNVKLQIQRPMPRLYVERNRMRQVFLNLIDNAIKHMDKRRDGRVEIGHTQTDGMHQFHVADNGPGIAPEDQEQIFRVFRRAATAAHPAVPGKGLGLALVRSIAERYGGHAWVESELGKGSAFYISFSARLTCPPSEGSHEEGAGAEHRRVPVGDGSVG